VQLQLVYYLKRFCLKMRIVTACMTADKRNLAMLRKSRSPSAGYVRVIFELPSSLWASCIYLVGDFNDWREDEICLYQDRSGAWTTSLDLLEGETYEFRYIIDGQWRTDFQADAVTDNIYASQNSIVIAMLPDIPAKPEPNGERMQD
jgi:hypothetical protein